MSATQRAVRGSINDTDHEKISYVVIARGKSPRAMDTAEKRGFLNEAVKGALKRGWEPSPTDNLTRALLWNWDRIM